MRWIALVALVVACDHASPARPPDAAIAVDAGEVDAPIALSNRDRLLATYLAFLRSTPATTQTNGLSGANLATTCALWTALDPSSRATFLTITARLAGSHLADGSAMLDHVTTLYRAVGGDGATASDPGTCGGGENNRLIMAMDDVLHAALRSAFDNQGGSALTDIPTGGFWRDSHDLGGPHAPFDESCETENGAPRGQVQYFHDLASTAATSPLGRTDLATLVDPHALEMDEDYDCAHSSNPLCDYTLYGALCAPATTMSGVDLYTASYGDFDPTWRPVGC